MLFPIRSRLYLVLMSVYYGLGVLLLLLPRVASLPKLQPGRELSSAEVLRIVRACLLPHLTIYPLGFCLAWPLAARCLRFEGEGDSLVTVLAYVVALALLTEVLFYYGHWHLHSPYWYAKVHKAHHEWKAPIGLAALYFHPLEHAQTLFDALAPPLVLGAHIRTFHLWTGITVAAVVLHHSGFELGRADKVVPWFDSMVKQHDLHHEHFVGNYGVIGILDWLHGTTTAEELRRRQKAT
mmetsp:Transcript_75326/g.232987  ORF Transcript_75326/g.232987 Transcript_75326/m.232987 type:complete len:238 (-) Transcript_75326:50-763(-)